MMAGELQVKRGTSGQIDAYTGPVGEPVFDTDTNELVLQDGTTPGGHRVGGSSSGGHTIREDGTPLTARPSLNFASGLVASDDAGNSRTNVNVSSAVAFKTDIAAGDISPAPADLDLATATTGQVLTKHSSGNIQFETPSAATVTVDQYDIVARIASGSGSAGGLAAGDLTEEATPAAGDYLLGWESGGALRIFDVGNITGSQTGAIVTATPSDGEFLVTEDMAVDDQVLIVAEEAVEILIPQSISSGVRIEITVKSSDVVLSIEDWTNSDDGYFEYNEEEVGTVELKRGYVVASVIDNPGTEPVIELVGAVEGLGTSATGPTDFNGHTVSGGIFLAAVSTDNTGRTLALADAYSRIIECSNGSGQTFTIPTNATVPFPIGTVIGFLQLGSGAITIAAAGGVTLEIPDGLTAVTRGENHMAFIRKRTTNTWHVAGGAGRCCIA